MEIHLITDQPLDLNIPVNSIENNLQNYINPKSFIKRHKLKQNSNEIADNIINIFTSSGRTIRKGPRPSKETIECIKQKLLHAIDNNQPILISISYGCHKTIQFQDYKDCDIAELFSIVQLQNINNLVSQLYSPGIQYYLSIHDSWWNFIYQKDDAAIDKYCSGIETIIKILNYNNIEVERLSTFIQRTGKDKVYGKAEEFNKIFYNYWMESNNHNEEVWATLQSYKYLVDIGWRGTIPNVMRNFYLAKMDRLLPQNATYKDKVNCICRYFAFGRAIDTFDLSKRKLSVINFSYITAPPGVPKVCVDNRIFIRSMPNNTTSKQLPPWTVAGIINYPEIYPSIITDKDLINYKLVQKSIMQISDNGHSLDLPADIYSKI